MYDFTEHTLTNHIENSHFVTAVATVFKKHTNLTCTKACSNHLPALFNRSSTANLHTNVKTCVHSINSYHSVSYPRSSDNNSIKFFLFKHFLIIKICVNRVCFFISFFNYFDTSFRSFGDKVANCRNSYTLNL